jgi:HEAT repeats
VGFASRSNGYVLRQAELWRVSAKEHVERGAAPEIAENALLAAALAFGEIGQASRVHQVYGELAVLDLEEARRDHYRRAQRRYVAMKDDPVEASPATPGPRRSSADFNEVWRVDVLEWERGGAASEVCADLILDPRLPEFLRRRAMLARMTALEVERREDDSSPAAEALREQLAEELAKIQLYAVLSPLEHLFLRPDARVRRAVLRAIGTLSFFKRSFVTLRAGLADADPDVVAQALRAIESLDFEHAFDPLSRLVRESADPDARAAALRSLARIDSTDAAEFLRGVLAHGSPADQRVVTDALGGRPKRGGP